MAKFFQPSVDCVIQAVIEQEKAALHKISVSRIMRILATFSAEVAACYPCWRLCGE